MKKMILLALAVVSIAAVIVTIGAASGVDALSASAAQQSITPQGSHMNGCMGMMNSNGQGMMTGQGCSHMVDSNGNQCPGGDACIGGCTA